MLTAECLLESDATDVAVWAPYHHFKLQVHVASQPSDPYEEDVTKLLPHAYSQVCYSPKLGPQQHTVATALLPCT